MTLAAWVHVMRREPERVEDLADRALAVSADFGLVFFSAIASVQRGWASAVLGRDAPSAELMDGGIRGYCAIGAGTHEVGYRLLAVDGWVHLGRLDDAERELAAAFTAMARHGERHLAAELERLQGELVLMRDPGRIGEAEERFRTALDVARRQDAASLELRAALSLARLRGAGDALESLRRVHARFGEGFDTADLAGAEALLRGGLTTPIAR